MARPTRVISEIRLVNGSTGDPVLFLDYPGKNDAILFDCGDNGRLDLQRFGDLEAVFLTHHHMDHFIGFDRILRANLDRDKTLHVFGPAGTIERIYQRIKSYEIQHFAFQKLVCHVHEILPGGEASSQGQPRQRSSLLECSRKFPPPEVAESSWSGPTIYESAGLSVEAAPIDHTTLGLAYALVESVGWHPDAERLESGSLRPGAWVSQVLELLRQEAAPDTAVEMGAADSRWGCWPSTTSCSTREPGPRS